MNGHVIVATLILAIALASAIATLASAQQVPCNPQFQTCN